MVDANLSVSDSCLNAYNRLKMDKDLLFITFRVVNQSTVEVEHAQPKGVPFDHLAQHLPANEPRFAVVDFDFQNADGIATSKIMFVHWSPDSSKVAPKMIYSSTKENLKRKFPGIYKEIQANSHDEVNHEAFLQAVRL